MQGLSMSTGKVSARRRVSSAMVAAVLGTLVASGAAGPMPVLAQDSSTPVVAETGVPLPGTVAVNGHGSVDVEPDTAQITIGVSVTLPTMEEAQTQSNAQTNALIEALQAAGIAEEDLQTSNFSVWVVRNYDEQGNPSDIQGYQISNQLNVTVRDISTVGAVLEAAIDAGANDIWGISFYVDDPSAAQSEARKLAVEDARRKAEELAAASGMSLGRVLAIAEGTGLASPMPLMAQRGGGGMAMDAAAAPIQPGTNEVAVDVQVVYELVGE
jgi:uncharacterized protein